MKEVVMKKTGIGDVTEVMQCEQRYPEAVGQWTREQHCEALDNPDILHVTFYSLENSFVGYAIMRGISSKNRNIELMRVAVAKPGNGYGCRILSKIQKHCFGCLNANRLWLDVREHNMRAQKAYERAGFQREGLLREAVFAEGVFHSLYIMAILKGDYTMVNIKEMPKVELHCHLDGSIHLHTMKLLAQECGKPLGRTDEELMELLTVPDDCPSLKVYLERFELPLQYLAWLENFKIAAYCLLEEAAKENVKYLEMRFAPSLSATEAVSAEAIVGKVIEGIRLAEHEYDIRGGVIISFMRHEPAEDNIKLLHQLKGFYGNGVCGIDTAGNEAAFPMETQKALFEEANRLGIQFTIHAGECGNAQNIREAVELGAKRIGHGVAMMDEPEIRALCAKKGVGIEMCPISNIQTKAIADFADYPISRFMEEGLLVTVNTDNRMVSDTSMTKELELVYETFGTDPYAVTRNAIDVSFADEATKQWLREQLEK